MSDPVLKLSDVKSFQELAHVLTYPTVAVAYFLQSGPVIGWEGIGYFGIPDHFSASEKLGLYFFYFALKALWACGILILCEFVLNFFEEVYAYILFGVLSSLFIGVGLLGIVARDNEPLLATVNNFWFYACIIWGFGSLSRIDARAKERSRMQDLRRFEKPPPPNGGKPEVLSGNA